MARIEELVRRVELEVVQVAAGPQTYLTRGEDGLVILKELLVIAYLPRRVQDLAQAAAKKGQHTVFYVAGLSIIPLFELYYHGVGIAVVVGAGDHAIEAFGGKW